MQRERDHLCRYVFPRLEEELRKRRHQLEPIDLRLGVETAQLGTEEARELLVLKVCLTEIQRSRPFLLVVLGDRYGWVPPEDRMAAATQEAGFKADVRGKSVTALEIEFGVLKEHPDQRRRSFFYLRDPLPYETMPPAVAADYSDAHSPDPAVRARHAKLQALKAQLAADPELGPRVHRYHADWDAARNGVTGLEAWAEMVFQHLWRELDEETRAFASQPPPTEDAQERAALVEFVEHRRRHFTGREELLGQLLALARSPAVPAGSAVAGAAWGACLAGSPGSGKSAVFAELWQRLSADPAALILANAAGATPRGSQVDAMLRRFIQELADFLKAANPLPEKAGPDDVDAAFASLLARAAARTRVVVLLDALDQFEPTPRGEHLTWLRPRQWPANARLIATALPGVAATALSQFSGIEPLNLPPLTAADAAEIGKQVWKRYHRELSPDVLRVLTEKLLPDGTAACGNPLWLTLALEQLNLLDADDFARADRDFSGSPAQRLHALVLDTARRMPPGVPELYDWLLAYTEKAYGQAHARAFAAIIALGRFGWREADLLPLVPRVEELLFPGQAATKLDELNLAALRRGFRAHLARRGAAGQLDFFHAQMRQAVRHRALGDPELVRRVHRAIADHLETLPADDPLRETELMVHLIEGDDPARAARLYADLPNPSRGLNGATAALARHIALGAGQRPNPSVPWIASLLVQSGLTPQQVANLGNRFNFDLDDAIENTADLSTRRSLLDAAQQALRRLAVHDPGNADWQLNLSASHSKVGNLLVVHGDAPGALEEYRASLAIAERLVAQDPTNVEWQRYLSVGHDKVGDVLLAQGDAAGALSEHRNSMAIEERLAAQDPTNAIWQRDLSVTHGRVGHVLLRQGDAAGALVEYRASLTIRARLAAQDPTNVDWQRDLSASHGGVGDLLLAQGDVAGALEEYRAFLAIAERLGVKDPTNNLWQRGLAVSHGRVGNVLLALGDAAGALREYRASLAIDKRLAAQDPTNADSQRYLSVGHNNVGNVLLAQGDAAGASREYGASLAIDKRLAAQDPTNADWQRNLSVGHSKMGDVLLAQGDAAGALGEYRAGLAIAERLTAEDPTNAEWQRDLSITHEKVGDMLLAQGDAAGALGEYRAGLAIHERLAARDPTNADWQSDLWVSYWGMANLAEKSRRADEAKTYWRKAHDTLAGMKRKGLFISPQDEGFLLQLRAKVNG